jgi:hypothetical protein
MSKRIKNSNERTDGLTILHLSDLHFGAHGMALSDELASDIVQQLEGKKNILVLVTGDIIDQAKFREHRHLAVNFFQQIKDANLNIKGVYFAPGNHDKDRGNKALNDMLKKIKFEADDAVDIIDEKYLHDAWNANSTVYKDYVELKKEIIRKLVGDDIENSNGDDIYGYYTVSLGNFNVAICCLDSSWCAAETKKDHRKLVIGEFQREAVRKKHRDQQTESLEKNGKLKAPGLTIAMCHHPIDSLRSEEEDELLAFLGKEQGIGANLFLCGHDHSRRAVNTRDHHSSLITLMTGIGKSDKGKGQVVLEGRRYSIYNVNPDMNSVEIIARSSYVDGVFNVDYSFLTGHNIKAGKIIYPLSYKGYDMHLKLPLSDGSTVAMFPNEEAISKIKKCVEKISAISLRLSDHLADEFGVTFIRHARGVQHKNNKISALEFYLFKAFLALICTEIDKEFFDEKNVTARIFFRLFNSNSKQYEHFVTGYWARCTKKPRPVELDNMGLIKHALDTKKSLLGSLNSEHNCFACKKWDDFLTAVPPIINNTIDQSGIEGGRGVNQIPLLTFSISYSEENDGQGERSDINLLHILNFFEIEKVLANWIGQFMKLTKRNINDYWEHYKENIQPVSSVTKGGSK